MAKKKRPTPTNGPMRKLIEEMLERAEGDAKAVAAGGSERGLIALARFQFNARALLRPALDLGGEAAAQAAIAFQACCAGSRAIIAADVDRFMDRLRSTEAARRKGPQVRSQNAQAREAQRFDDFEKRRQAAPNRGPVATYRLMAQAELGSVVDDAQIAKRAETIRKSIARERARRESERPELVVSGPSGHN